MCRNKLNIGSTKQNKSRAPALPGYLELSSGYSELSAGYSELGSGYSDLRSGYSELSSGYSELHPRGEHFRFTSAPGTQN